MTIESVKCKCQHCDGHLEFESDSAGHTVNCPHCGLDTMLYIPQAPVRPAVVHPKKVKSRRIWWWLITLGACLLILAAVGAWSGIKLIELAGMTVSGIATAIYLIIGLIVILFALIVAILWIVFPVFVYFGMNRIENLLAKIETNTRR